MFFRLMPLEFEYIAHGPLQFAAGKATNIIRGALGLALRHRCCPPDCQHSRRCSRLCLYQQLFEGETGGPRPSGYQKAPRPFVLRSPDWAGRTFKDGEHFTTSIHLFDLRPEVAIAFIEAYSQLGDAGLGPGRVPVRLCEIRPQPAEVLTLDLSPDPHAPSQIRVRFVTPTEIKIHGQVSRDATFAPLFTSLLNRVRFLMLHYGNVTPPTDELLTAARKIITLSQNLRGLSATRYSTRTGQTHPLDGFIGEAVYQGDFTLLWPWLKAGEWTGVGRQTVWGKGVLEVSSDSLGNARLI